MTILSILRLAPNPSPSVLNEDSSSLRFLDRNGLDFILGLVLLKLFFRLPSVGNNIFKKINVCRYIRVSHIFLDFKVHIKVYRRLQFLEYLRTLSLKFQKARTKIEVVLTLPCWLSLPTRQSQENFNFGPSLPKF